MAPPRPGPPGRPHGVATQGPDRLDSPRLCLHCGVQIPKPRQGQKACSSRCRWALWKAGRETQAAARLARDQEICELLEAALGKLKEAR